LKTNMLGLFNTSVETFERKVFDCVQYNGESHMLYIRLWRLYPFVTKFIIVLSNTTHSGRPKVNSFEPFTKEINSFKDKIYFYYYEPKVTNDYSSQEISWKRENAQRNSLLSALRKFSPKEGDLILMGDLDEIPTRQGMELILENPPTYCYYLKGIFFTINHKYWLTDWSRFAVIVYTNTIHSFQTYRDTSHNIFEKGGYTLTHCTYCFPKIEMFVNKFKSSAHTEFSVYPFTNESYIFKRHYCRIVFHTNLTLKKTNHNLDFSQLIPNDPRMKYLIDENFRLDISKTIYKESDLPTLCNSPFTFP